MDRMMEIKNSNFVNNKQFRHSSLIDAKTIRN